jgi:Protein of unknown function (DUF3224)
MRAGFAALFSSLLVGLVLASGAAATKDVHVSGTYTVTDLGTTTCAPLGSSAFMLRCDTTGFVSQYAGDMTGTAIVDFTQLIDCRSGHTRGEGVETFTGTINGVGVGTLTWHDHFRATTDCLTFALSDFVLKGVGLSGTGDLAGLDGRLDFTLATYDGTLH